MARFFLDGPPAGDRVTLEGAEAHHAARVHRLRAGDSLHLFDGSGTEYRAVVEAVGRRAIEARILSRDRVEREPAIAITVACAVPKGPRMSRAVRALAELGVEAIVPLVCERSVVRPRRDGGEHAPERLSRIALEASKQSGRARVTRVEPFTPLERVLDGASRFDLALCGEPATGAAPLREVVDAARLAPSARLLMLLGPEGGITPDEQAHMRRAGCVAVSLGRSILRIETAMIASVAAVVALVPGPGDEQVSDSR